MDYEHLLFLRDSINMICCRCTRDFCDDCPLLKFDSKLFDILNDSDDYILDDFDS